MLIFRESLLQVPGKTVFLFNLLMFLSKTSLGFKEVSFCLAVSPLFPALIVFQTFACARKLSSEVSGNIILLGLLIITTKTTHSHCLYLLPISHTLVSLVTSRE